MSNAALTWDDRIVSYTAYCKSRAFPPALVRIDDWTVGYWLIGNNYVSKAKYYGEYPPTYLERMQAIFPEAEAATTLHLFSGKTDTTVLPGDTCDINASLNPTFVANAEDLSGVPLERYRRVFADPPYDAKCAAIYGYPLPLARKVMWELRRLPLGAYVIWIDTRLPMHRADIFQQEAGIGIQRSTNHVFRCVSIFRRIDGAPSRAVQTAAERRRINNGKADHP
jgi:hypothetical protein